MIKKIKDFWKGMSCCFNMCDIESYQCACDYLRETLAARKRNPRTTYYETKAWINGFRLALWIEEIDD